MEPWMWVGVVLVGGMFVIVVACAVAAKRRTAAWQQAADALGLEFLGKENDLLERFGHLRLLSVGLPGQFTNVVRGRTDDTEITIADFLYEVPRNERLNTYQQTVCILRSPQLQGPRCLVRPESRLGDLFGDLFCRQDIDFDDDPEFSAGYQLQGDDEEAVRAAFDAPTRAWFVQRNRKRFCFEADGDTLLFHTGRRISPRQTQQLMQQALEILKLLGKRGDE
ncbi:MAG: hypothetical protein HQ567_32775 [Candidatus Nealsonbacteria bacterium]|nr:hypothetical protein [Candidatus Nealsonbacteria bacterium]